MKKIILIIFLSIFIYPLIQANDFRNADWGMTIDEVKKAETAPFEYESPDGKYVFFNESLIGNKFSIIYYFLDKQLIWACYFNKQEHTNRNDYIDDYDKLKELLQKKYGSPLEDRQVWKNDLYKNDRQNWGMAVAAGHLAYISNWEIDNTKIILLLKGDNFKITLYLKYKEKSSEALQKEKEEKEILDDL